MAAINANQRRKKAFLAAYRETANVTKAATLAKIERTTHYLWLRTDAEYRDQFEESRDEAAQTLEDEAVRRAHEGTSKPIYQSGRLVGYVQEYSDTLLIFLLKAARPGKFRERFDSPLDARDIPPLVIQTSKE